MNKIVLCLLLSFGLISYSQVINTQLPNISPPSPESYGLGSYGNLPIGLSTGAINKQLPIVSFKTNNIEVPVYLAYVSNGLKVDELESIVGLGWRLNAGGIITRVVRDKPDDENYGSSPGIPKKMLDEIHRKSPESQEYFYLKQQDQSDSEDDIFYINVNGINGKFHIKNNNEVQLVNNHEIKIDFDITDSYNFIMTDSNGVKYYFEESQVTNSRVSGGGYSPMQTYYSAWYLTKIVHPFGDEVYFKYSSNNKLFVASMSQYMEKSYPHYQTFPNGVAYTQNPYVSNIYSHHMNTTDKYVSRIYSNNPIWGSLEFEYIGKFLSLITQKDREKNVIDEITFNNYLNSNNRTFLKEIKYKDSTKKYSFNYINEANFPSRLSFSQDNWGYYNGQNNSNLIPSGLKGYSLEGYNYNGSNRDPFEDFAKTGLLEYIYYPTKGFTKIEYESNDYNTTEVVSPNPTSENLHLNLEEDDFGTTTHSVIISPSISQQIDFFGSSSFNRSACSNQFDLGFRHNAVVRMYCIEDDQFVNFFKNQTNVSSSVQLPAGTPQSFYALVRANKTYRVDLSSSRLCTRAGVYLSYIKDAPETISHNVITGGVRVKKTSNYKSDDNLNPIIKRYYYSKINKLDISSGNKGADPFFISKGYKLVDSPFTYGTTINVTSSSLINLFDTGNNSVFYKYVSISHGGDNFENGGEEIKFNTDRDYFGETINYSIPLTPGLDDNRAATLTNFGFKNGLELKRKIFDANLNLQSEKETIYETIPLTESVQYNFRVEVPYHDLANSSNNLYNCSQEATEYSYNSTECSTNHTHASVNLDGFYCIAKNANNVPSQSINHSCYQLPVHTILTHNFHNQNVTITKYKNLSYHIYPKTILEKTYFDNGFVSNTSAIEIRDEYPFLNSISKQTNSKGELLERKFYYSLDFPTDPIMSELVNQNRISEPVLMVSVKTDENNIILSEEKLRKNFKHQNSLVLIENVESAKVNDDFKNIFTYHKHDGYGNPLEISKTDDEYNVHIVYIWGYNQTLPIAKIENATYTEIQSYVSNLRTLSNNDMDTSEDVINSDGSIDYQGDEGLLREALNDLRTIDCSSPPPDSEASCLKDALITTYTYNPLVGVTSVTDPRGNVIYYKYDEFNRLKYIKDRFGNILNKKDYNYKN
ncbi:hypothetical protein BZARG_368 [Bizionia argentinensis JUB59]|uniref:RHS repeat protein n=1 Tax=Bizionia argentinensis JUB59 TaxID=1046627 RepID=G2EGY1_9FLAO|nr:RHS repeat protein [Bizionia argentinensis]EGV42139.1 hypothetical protein BZARG_368 [Bizionia argentinensis JUB59]